MNTYIHTRKGLHRAEDGGRTAAPPGALRRGTVLDTTEEFVGLSDVPGQPGAGLAAMTAHHTREGIVLERGVENAPWALSGDTGGGTWLVSFLRTRPAWADRGVRLLHPLPQLLATLPQGGSDTRLLFLVSDRGVTGLGVVGREPRARVSEGLGGRPPRDVVGSVAQTLFAGLRERPTELVFTGDPNAAAWRDLIASYQDDPGDLDTRVVEAALLAQGAALSAVGVIVVPKAARAAKASAGRSNAGLALLFGALVFGAALGAAPALWLNFQRAAVEAEKARLEAQIAELRPELAEIYAMEAQLTERQQALNRSVEIERGQVDWAERLRRLTARVPQQGGDYTARFETLAATPSGTPPTVSYRMSMRAPSQGALISTIGAFEAEPFSIDVATVRIDETAGGVVWDGEIRDLEPEPEPTPRLERP